MKVCPPKRSTSKTLSFLFGRFIRVPVPHRLAATSQNPVAASTAEATYRLHIGVVGNGAWPWFLSQAYRAQICRAQVALTCRIPVAFQQERENIEMSRFGQCVFARRHLPYLGKQRAEVVLNPVTEEDAASEWRTLAAGEICCMASGCTLC